MPRRGSCGDAQGGGSAESSRGSAEPFKGLGGTVQRDRRSRNWGSAESSEPLRCEAEPSKGLGEPPRESAGMSTGRRSRPNGSAGSPIGLGGAAQVVGGAAQLPVRTPRPHLSEDALRSVVARARELGAASATAVVGDIATLPGARAALESALRAEGFQGELDVLVLNHITAFYGWLLPGSVGAGLGVGVGLARPTQGGAGRQASRGALASFYSPSPGPLPSRFRDPSFDVEARALWDPKSQLRRVALCGLHRSASGSVPPLAVSIGLTTGTGGSS